MYTSRPGRDFESLLADVSAGIGSKCSDAEIRHAANVIANDFKKNKLFVHCLDTFAIGFEPVCFEWPFGQRHGELALKSGKTIYYTLCYE